MLPLLTGDGHRWLRLGHGCLRHRHRDLRLRLPIAHSTRPAFRLHLGFVFGCLLLRAIGEGSCFTLHPRASLGLCLAGALGGFSGLFAANSLPRWGFLLSRGFRTAPLPRLGPLRGTPKSFAGALQGRVFGIRMLLVTANLANTLTFLAPSWRLCASPALQGH